MKGALDQAFVRRLRFVVTFPFPGRPEREAIWRRAWPAETPTRDLDYAHLARFSLTGGSIANVALHAAFRASAQGSAVTMPVVLGALRTELRKLERPVNDANLAWDDPVPAADARGAEPTASPSPPDRSPTPAGA
jgi:SpoVK/Ycf46/Vps4 family AAA+-type ATPase